MLQNFFRNMPGVVKNLLLINVLLFIAMKVFQAQGFDLSAVLGCYYFESEGFEPYQIITHMFMHSNYGLGHIFFNMFALVMFGTALERIWGAKRFLTFYLVCGLGAFVLHMGVNYVQIHQMIAELPVGALEIIQTEGYEAVLQSSNFVDPQLGDLNALYNGSIVGASGAIYGLLVAFGYLFPNTELMLIFFPVPIKAKYFIPFMMAAELFLGVGNFEWDNIAHFAHLGGAVIGFSMVYYWQKKKNKFY
jgi:membrane associated rhomboid family serine protease